MAQKATLTIASPSGGEAPLDPNSIKRSQGDEAAETFLANRKDVWQGTVPLSEIVGKEGEFEAVFFVGGHGRRFLFLPPNTPSLPD